MQMPLHVSWADIVIRLVLTVTACGLIGFNRGSRGHAAGLRTVILVGLAASLAMIQCNVLLTLSGKAHDMFAVMDLMRLPLGILTGVGFIGGGSIMKRGELVTGVTTAATLWVVTVIGLCLGGGQLVLGSIGTAFSLATLWGLRWVDIRIPRVHRGMLALQSPPGPVQLPDLDILVKPLGYRAQFRRHSQNAGLNKNILEFEVGWKCREYAKPPLDLLELVQQKYTIESFELTSEATDHGV